MESSKKRRRERNLSNCIRGIYIGTNYRRIEGEKITTLKELISICEERNLPLYVMRRSFTEYRLTPVRINGDNLSEEGRMELYNINWFIKSKESELGLMQEKQ